jgi:hypothetical protein
MTNCEVIPLQGVLLLEQAMLGKLGNTENLLGCGRLKTISLVLA